jgi:hypothetical protein
MKKDLLEWIDRETVRLDRTENGQEPENNGSDPVPDALRQALADEQDEGPPQKQ